MVHKVFATLGLTLATGVFCFSQDEKSALQPPDSGPSLEEEARREFSETDAKLRTAYDTLVTQLDVNQRKALDEVHSHWLAYREMAAKSAAALASPDDSHAPLLEILEMHRLTEHRLHALRRIIEARKVSSQG